MGEPSAGAARLEDVRDRNAGSGNKMSVCGGRSRGHDGRQSYEPVVRVDDPHGLPRPAGCDAERVPSTNVTPDPSGERLFRPGVTRPLAFFVGRGAERVLLWM